MRTPFGLPSSAPIRWHISSLSFPSSHLPAPTKCCKGLRLFPLSMAIGSEVRLVSCRERPSIVRFGMNALLLARQQFLKWLKEHLQSCCNLQDILGGKLSLGFVGHAKSSSLRSRSRENDWTSFLRN